MRVPPVITIAGIDYEVKWNDGKIITEDAEGKQVKIETIANIHFLDQTINLCGDYGEQTVDISLIHELVHGICFAMGYQQEMVVPSDDMERWTEGFAQILLQVMNQIIEYNMLYEEYYSMKDELEMAEESEEYLDAQPVEEYDTITIDSKILDELEEVDE